MQSLQITLLSSLGLLAMSACLQPASTSTVKLSAQTAGPVALDGDRSTNRDSVCRSAEGSDQLTKIGEGAEALFQILQTDAGDLNTIRERANHLVELEQTYAENFAVECAGSGLSTENTSMRIEKLQALATETDAAVIRALAAQIWDLFNPNLQIRGDVGTSSGNPFYET